MSPRPKPLKPPEVVRLIDHVFGGAIGWGEHEPTSNKMKVRVEIIRDDMGALFLLVR